jgi:hypothetical protein
MIFDKTQFGSVKIFSYVFFWMGFIVMLYPPYIMFAKWEWVGKIVEFWMEKSEKKTIESSQPVTSQAPQKIEKPMVANDGEVVDKKKKEELEREKETNRTVPKEHLEEAPNLKFKTHSWSLGPSNEISSENPPAVPEQQKKDPIKFTTNYCEDDEKTREQMYSNVWKHFRSDYRRMNPITRQDGVIEFAQMIESNLASQQTTKPNRRMAMTRTRPI